MRFNTKNEMNRESRKNEMNRESSQDEIRFKCLRLTVVYTEDKNEVLKLKLNVSNVNAIIESNW